MAAISEIAGDERGRSVGGALQLDIVIELDREDVDVGQALRHGVGPTSGIGEVTDPPRAASRPADPFDPETESRAGVVMGGDRFDAQPPRRQERAAVEGADEVLLDQLGITLQLGEGRQMCFMAIERNSES